MLLLPVCAKKNYPFCPFLFFQLSEESLGDTPKGYMQHLTLTEVSVNVLINFFGMLAHYHLLDLLPPDRTVFLATLLPSLSVKAVPNL